MKQLSETISSEVGRVVAGRSGVVEAITVCLAARGHLLLEGVPGVAKTLVATSTARALGVETTRVQFTPDMLPSDLTGTMTLRGGDLVFHKGPVFTNLLIADEINRTPPKTQAALLEAMQERQVSIEGEPEKLPDPFIVVATQNPVEYEGTYPLPEAQLDRFLLKLDIGYPSADVEKEILRLSHNGIEPAGVGDLKPVAGPSEIEAARRELDSTTVSEEIVDYVAQVVRKTRDLPSVSLGASPRASVHLLAAARASARLLDRDFVIPDDVIRMAPPVLRHRIVLSPDAALERYKPDDAVAAAIAAVPVPR